MRKLVSYGLENYEYRDVWQEPSLTEIPVLDGVPWDNSPDGEAFIALKPDYGSETPSLSLLLREDEQVLMTVETAESLTAPVPAGTVAGTITYTLNGEPLKSYNLLTIRDVAERDFEWYLRYLWNLTFAKDQMQ